MRPRMALGVVVAVGVGLLTGCGGSNPAHPIGSNPVHPIGRAGAAPAVFTGHVQALHPGSLTASGLGAADQEFGMRLLHDACAVDPGNNTVLSPASAAQALGMTQTGARGPARTALSRLLNEPAYGPAVIAAEHARTSQLRKVSGLTTSNRVFIQSGITPQQATLNDLRTAYDARLQTLDFAGHPKVSTNTVNHLISGDTHGLIPHLFDSPLDGSTQIVLTNAIYLKAEWQNQFTPPALGAFTMAGGKHITVPTLRALWQYSPSASVNGWISVQLPYVHGQVSAYVLLPPADAQTCAVPDTAAFTTLLHTDTKNVATVTMPQFHLTQTTQLLKILTSEGLQPGGDYAGFAPGAQISQIVQKVDISVNEYGTTAAASTDESFGVSLADSTHVNLDRPFLFLITDTATHTPLFLARIADPRG